MVQRARKQTGFYKVDDFSVTASKSRKGSSKKKRSTLNPDLSLDSDRELEMLEEEEEEEVPTSNEAKAQGSSDDEEAILEPELKPKRKPIAKKKSKEVNESKAVDETAMTVVVSPSKVDNIDDKGNTYFGKLGSTNARSIGLMRSNSRIALSFTPITSYYL
jgi:hypothetical protein